MDYRENIIRNAINAEQSDVDKETEFMLIDDVKEMLDEIEARVLEVKDKLEKITGLTEVEEIQSLVEKLSSDLY